VLTITTTDARPLEVEADLLVVPVFKGGIEGPGVSPVLDALGLDELPATPEFRGDIGQSLIMAAPGLPVGGVMFVGLGRMDATDSERLRRAAGVAARAARGVSTIATTLTQVHSCSAALEAIAEGFHLGAYADRRFKTDDEGASRLTGVTLLIASSQQRQATEALRRAEIYARATITARDLVNLPPDRKRPPELARQVEALVSPACEVTVLDETTLAEEGFNGILAVGRGSAEPPRLVEIRYRPDNPLAHIVLVGKGITFDTGGLNLKRGTSMSLMKSDMSGAAAVAAACSVLADLGVRLDVTGLLPLAENMPGDDAQRPDDIITMHGGITVEVRDTDAEGRLVLGDALDYAAGMDPDAIVDLATLTGSAINAIGQYAAAAMSNDEELVASVLRAAGVAGESLAQLPLWPDLERYLDTPVADINNTGDGAGGGAIMGGLFLKRFVGDVPWVHLDIAGPSFLESKHAGHYLSAGGTGYGVRTLLAWLERRAD
jgi:leucyl aminopeptidase